MLKPVCQNIRVNTPVTQAAAPQEPSLWDEFFGETAPVSPPTESSPSSSDSVESEAEDFLSVDTLTAPLRWARQFFSDDENPENSKVASSSADNFPTLESPQEFSLSYYYDYAKKVAKDTVDSGVRFLFGTSSSSETTNLANQSSTSDYPYSFDFFSQIETAAVKPKSVSVSKSSASNQKLDLIPVVPVSSAPLIVNSYVVGFDDDNDHVPYSYFSSAPQVTPEEIDHEEFIPIRIQAPVFSYFVSSEIFEPLVVVNRPVMETPLVIERKELTSTMNQSSSVVNEQPTPIRTFLVSELEQENDTFFTDVTGSTLISESTLVPVPVTDRDEATEIAEAALIYYGSSEVLHPISVSKKMENFSSIFPNNEVLTLSHQSTVVKFSDTKNDEIAPKLSLEMEPISASTFDSHSVVSQALSPVMKALKLNEECGVETTWASGFIYIHGGMMNLFYSHDEFGGRVTDGLHAERRARILATVSAGSRSEQEDRQQKPDQDYSALYQSVASV